MNTDGEEINRCAPMVSEKDFYYKLSQTLMEELIMDAHEISMQSAVMSGLEDVNSSQFFTRSDMNNVTNTTCNYIRNTSAK